MMLANDEKLVDSINGVELCKIIKRLNRFVVLVEHNNHIYRALLRNTGKLYGIIEPGKHAVCTWKKQGKTHFNLIGVIDVDDSIAIVDTNLQEKIFMKSIEKGYLHEFKKCKVVKRNPRIGNSRLDFLLECRGKPVYIELKSAVMRGEDGVTAQYPDTPSDRGVRHMLLLLDLRRKGYRPYLIFISGLPNVKRFAPNYKVDPRLRDIVPKLRDNGVGVLSYRLHGEIVNNDLYLYITSRSISVVV